jgi:sulfite reductase beta subunit-like hemoprotein
VAIIASDTDRAAMRLHDIGIQIVKNEAGEIGCKFFAGGGMGRTPMIAPCIAEFVPALQMISFLEAALRVYNRHGRRDNKYKARIKILVHEIGVDEYAARCRKNSPISSRWASNRRRPSSNGSRRCSPIRASKAACRTISTAAIPISRCGSTRTSTPTSSRLCDRHDQPQAGGRHSGRRHRRPDPPDGRPGA